MTDYEDSAGQSPVYSDGIEFTDLSSSLATRKKPQREAGRFWASVQRTMDSHHREIMEVSFGGERLVNHLSFEVSRFPLVLHAEYLDANGDWQGVTYAQTRGKKGTPRREVRNDPVRMVISESVPRRVNSAQAKHHPQHFGKDHWRKESWKIRPVTTRKIRMVVVRNHLGTPPKNHHGTPVAYSVAIKNLSIGYRVLSEEDVPNSALPWWASSKDILGGQVVYSTYGQPATRAIDGDSNTYWRSEPQPFPFAVVNMYLDLRDQNGEASVVDGFWVDPATPGAMCNLYYSNSEPEGDFVGLSAPIPSSFRDEVGAPIRVLQPQSGQIVSLDLGPEVMAGVSVSGTYLRMRYDHPWWVGIDCRALVATTDPDPHVIASLGSIQILQKQDTLSILAQDGTQAVITLDPTLHGEGTRFRLIASYHPEEEGTQRGPYFRLTYAIEGHLPQSEEIATQAVVNVVAPIKIGLHPDPATLDVPAVSVHGLVLKSEELTEDTEQWFLDEGEAYVADPRTRFDDRGTAINARLRMHPDFVTDENPFGVVGGVGDRFDEMVWTAIPRDYTLRRGTLHVPPTKAKYWKLEMTGLLPQVYENFIPIEREVLVFPPEVVKAHQQALGLADDASIPSGAQTTGNTSPTVAYDDMLQPTPVEVPADSTQALVIRDPKMALRASQTGWVWNYQPWHVGSSAPQFMGTQRHHYETLQVRHNTKVAFFVGIREIQPMRTNYAFADDTVQYAEHFLDDTFISDLQSVEHFDGGIRAVSSSASATSASLQSYRTVRGVQFATQETDAIQVLTDPDFISPRLDFWYEYGDASMERLDRNDVLIRRGWVAYTYADLEVRYPTYGTMDGVPYGQLEGNAQSSGYAEGGLTSDIYTPSGAGSITLIAEVSAGAEEMDAPVVVEIVSTYGDKVVASGLRWLRAGETSTIKAVYTPGTINDRRTYSEVELMSGSPTTYGQLDLLSYRDVEYATGIQSDIYVRVRQQGASAGSFHVNRVGLYDSPVAWFFSNDDGDTWWQAIGVKDDPYAVLLFPEDPSPSSPLAGRALRWRAKIFMQDASVSALYIRPWYGTRDRSVSGNHSLAELGPNKSVRDDLPPTHLHPMWTDRFNPIEHEYEVPVWQEPFWRNLVLNPTGRSSDLSEWTAGGGTIAADPAVEAFAFTSTGTATSLLLSGPSGSVHEGAFAIAKDGLGAGHVTFAGTFEAGFQFLVQVYAEWMRWDGTQLVTLDSTEVLAPMVVNGVDGGSRRIGFDAKALSRATHWRPRFIFSLTRAEGGVEAQPLSTGQVVEISRLYLPDNGLPVLYEPYLDGSLPGARWEGTPNDSTSIYDPNWKFLALGEALILDSSGDSVTP